jgi:hypothetical protein
MNEPERVLYTIGRSDGIAVPYRAAGAMLKSGNTGAVVVRGDAVYFIFFSLN